MHHNSYNTIAYACVYAHPFEFVFGNMLPIFIGLYIWGPYIHIVTFANYLAWSLMETHETHSGYSFDVSPFNCFPFSSIFIS